MKLETIKSYNLKLTEKELSAIVYCFDYCYHRLKEHEDTGLHGKIEISLVNHFRRIIHDKVGW